MFTSTAITNRSHLHTQRCTLYWLSSSAHHYDVFLKEQPFNSTLLNNVASKYIFLHPKDPRPPSSNLLHFPHFHQLPPPSPHLHNIVSGRFTHIAIDSQPRWYPAAPTQVGIPRFPPHLISSDSLVTLLESSSSFWPTTREGNERYNSALLH